MAFCDTYGVSTGAGVEKTKFLVSAGGSDGSASHIERKGLDGIAVAVEGRARTRWIGEIPQFHEVFPGCSCEHVGRSWVPKNLTDLFWAYVDPCDGLQVARFPSVQGPAIKEAVGDFPKETSAIFGGGSDEGVVCRGPGSVENGCCVGAGEGNDIGEF